MGTGYSQTQNPCQQSDSWLLARLACSHHLERVAQRAHRLPRRATPSPAQRPSAGLLKFSTHPPHPLLFGCFILLFLSFFSFYFLLFSFFDFGGFLIPEPYSAFVNARQCRPLTRSSRRRVKRPALPSHINVHITPPFFYTITTFYPSAERPSRPLRF